MSTIRSNIINIQYCFVDRFLNQFLLCVIDRNTFYFVNSFNFICMKLSISVIYYVITIFINKIKSFVNRKKKQHLRILVIKVILSKNYRLCIYFLICFLKLMGSCKHNQNNNNNKK